MYPQLGMGVRLGNAPGNHTDNFFVHFVIKLSRKQRSRLHQCFIMIHCQDNRMLAAEYIEPTIVTYDRFNVGARHDEVLHEKLIRATCIAEAVTDPDLSVRFDHPITKLS